MDAPVLADPEERHAPARAVLPFAWATLFLLGADLFAVSPLLPRIAAEARVGPDLAGLLVTVFSLTYFVAAPALGAASDRVGRRRVLIGGLLGFAAANLLTGLSVGFVPLLASRALAGLCAAAVSPTVYALVGERAPPERRATWLGIAASGLLVALPVGAPLSVLGSRVASWHAVFAGFALGGAVLAAVVARSPLVPPGPPRAARPPDGRLGLGSLARGVGSTVAWSTTLYGVYTYLGAGLAKAGLPEAGILGVYVAYGCGNLLGTLIGGRLADRAGPRRTAIASLAGFSLCYALLPVGLGSPALVGVAFFVAPLVGQAFLPAQQARLAALHPTRRGQILAWNGSALYLGMTLGSGLGGFVLERAGFGGVLLACAGVGALGCAGTALLRE